MLSKLTHDDFFADNSAHTDSLCEICWLNRTTVDFHLVHNKVPQ